MNITAISNRGMLVIAVRIGTAVHSLLEAQPSRHSRMMPEKIGAVTPLLKMEETASGDITRISSIRLPGSVFNLFHELSNSAPVRGVTILMFCGFFDEDDEGEVKNGDNVDTVFVVVNVDAVVAVRIPVTRFSTSARAGRVTVSMVCTSFFLFVLRLIFTTLRGCVGRSRASSS